jgi:hypothetical protein
LQERDRRPVLTLALSDLRGYASADLAPEEVALGNGLHRRLDDLIGEMISSSPREHIEIRDLFATAQQLDVFGQHLGQIPDIAHKRLKLHNKIRNH